MDAPDEPVDAVPIIERQLEVLNEQVDQLTDALCEQAAEIERLRAILAEKQMRGDG